MPKRPTPEPTSRTSRFESGCCCSASPVAQIGSVRWVRSTTLTCPQTVCKAIFASSAASISVTAGIACSGANREATHTPMH